MYKKYKKIWINLMLILAIVLVLGFAYIGFIAGPKRAYEKEDHLYLEAYLKQSEAKKAELLNRFTYDDVYYIVRKDDQDIVVFNKDFTKEASFDYVSLEKAEEVAKNLSFQNDQISYGYFEDQLVFVLKNKKSEIFIATDDLKILYHLGSDF